MDHEKLSSFKIYSFGLVVKDKPRDTDMIDVIPVEEITIGTGKKEEVTSKSGQSVNYKVKNETKLLVDESLKYDITLKDHQGVDRTQLIKGDLIIKAKWTAFGHSNRITSPDVIKNETVILFRVADTDEYYWTTLMREPSIRRQETVNYGYGNIPKGLEEFDKDTSYWAEVSTHDKYIHVHTSKNDAEPFEYDIKVDTAKGTVDINDNAGNNIFLESNPSKITINTNSDIEMNTSKVTINASSSVDVNTPITTFSGDVHVKGNHTIDGNLTVGGSTNLKSLSTNGDTILNGGTITAGGDDLKVDRT